MPSQSYVTMQERIERLRSHLLPATLDDVELQGDIGVQIRSISFRVLSHAELETYLEERVIEIAKTTLKSWEDKKLISRTAICLLGFSGREMRRPPETYAAPNENKRKTWNTNIDVHHRLSESISGFVGEVIRDNHGIREKNILSLLLPIGFDPIKLDAFFLAEIDNFGSQRGQAAHVSSESIVQQGINPKDEYDRVIQIVTALEQIDEGLDELLAGCT